MFLCAQRLLEQEERRRTMLMAEDIGRADRIIRPRIDLLGVMTLGKMASEVEVSPPSISPLPPCMNCTVVFRVSLHRVLVHNISQATWRGFSSVSAGWRASLLRVVLSEMDNV